VGGDYYDLIPLDRRRLGIVIADVAGKGVPALLVMGVARSVIRGQARLHLSPREVLIRANDIITPDIHRGMFVTVLYGLVDLERRSLTVANAGHNPLILVKRDGAQPPEVMKTQGRPVGFMVGPFFDDRLEETVIMLQEGDTVFVYTDGVLDALNANGEEFGMNRLLETLGAHREATPQAMVDAVLAALAAFVGGEPQHDDITLLALACREPVGEIPPAAGIAPAAAAGDGDAATV
jgi:sigma-B regulation protein RsbU (phosphoserine phosphatase)